MSFEISVVVLKNNLNLIIDDPGYKSSIDVIPMSYYFIIYYPIVTLCGI